MTPGISAWPRIGVAAGAGTASMPAERRPMTTRRTTTPREGSQTGGPTRPPRSVPDFDLAVERVPLDRRLAERLDQMDELLGRGAVRGTGGRDDVLLDHHRAHVVRPESQRDLTDLHPLRHPRGLDVGNVVQIEPADGLREQIVEGCRHRLARNPLGEAVAVGLKRPRNKRAGYPRLVPGFPQ